MQNSSEEFHRDTTEETLKLIDTTTKLSRSVKFIQQIQSDRNETYRRQTQYQRTTINFKSSIGNFFRKSPENNANYKHKKNKMNSNNSKKNNDVKQSLQITFQNTNYQSLPKTYTEATTQSNH